jgi:hypothetical protein
MDETKAMKGIQEVMDGVVIMVDHMDMENRVDLMAMENMANDEVLVDHLMESMVGITTDHLHNDIELENMTHVPWIICFLFLHAHNPTTNNKPYLVSA